LVEKKSETVTGYLSQEEADGMASEPEKRKKGRVYVESEKARYTTHWDMDYLPLGKLKTLYRQRGGEPRDREAKDSPSSLRLKRQVGWALIAAGLVMLALIGRYILS
jgi:hypothetical protein